MKYMLLIHNEEHGMGKVGQTKLRQIFAEFMDHTKQMKSNGHHAPDDRLQPTSTATSVHVRNRPQSVPDRPFVDTREQLGGYYVIRAKDLDEAISIAARMPSARLGTVEVRPVDESRV